MALPPTPVKDPGVLSRRGCLASIAGFSLAIAGCATPTPAPTTPPTLSGRLLLQISPQGLEPARQWSAGFELRGTAQAGELDLTSPLGTLVAQARWQPGHAELAQGGQSQRFVDLADLSLQLLGEAVPLEALFDWLRGRPWPALAHERTDAGFTQGGWVVDLTGLGAGTLTAQRPAAPALTLRARLEASP